jgi:catechol 2,3-dioxygenase-like lactoylglutathione lyase family enzyme
MATAEQDTGIREASGPESLGQLDMKVEVIVLSVSDVNRSKEFYQKLGWRLDETPTGVVQLTPHGSACSVQFGSTLTTAPPGSGKGYVIVSDIESARRLLIAAGIEVGEIFHLGPHGPESGPDPEHRTYRSRAVLSDPDGNAWLLQEITSRLPGRVDPGVTSFSSVTDVASALRRAAAAHGKHEQRIGHADANWPDWYAEYMVREQTGAPLPE